MTDEEVRQILEGIRTRTPTNIHANMFYNWLRSVEPDQRIETVIAAFIALMDHNEKAMEVAINLAKNSCRPSVRVHP